VGTVQGIQRPTLKALSLRRTATPAERALWRHLSASKLDGHKFSRQMPIGPYICDFMCRSRMLVVELDGYSHDVTADAEARRDRFMAERGFRILRFNNRKVFGNIQGVLTSIAATLRLSPPPAPPASGRGEEE
jgi:very-short-patch-repair endonuclease